MSLLAAFVLAWMEALSIDVPGFAAENIRLELMVGSLLTLVFCALLNPQMAPPGTLAPMIPMIPLMAAQGVHPLPLALLAGTIGILLSFLGAYPLVLKISSAGTRAGILMLFGWMGISSSAGRLWQWTQDHNAPVLLLLLLISGGIGFAVLSRRRQTWLTIPLCIVLGLVLPALFRIVPEFVTRPGLPLLDPRQWWLLRWGLGWGTNALDWLKALPYALLIVVMWPLDAVAITTMHERDYGRHADRLIFQLNSTFRLVGLRNMIAGLLGGAQIAAVWRSFLIPLGVVKRPIPGAALLLGLLGLTFVFSGYPIDLSMFPPLLHLVLMLGVFLPMLMAGLQLKKSPTDWLSAIVCLAAGYWINPLVGWALAVLASLLSARWAAFKKRGRL